MVDFISFALRYKLLLEKYKTRQKRFTKKDSDAIQTVTAVKTRNEILYTRIQSVLKFSPACLVFYTDVNHHRRMNKNSTAGTNHGRKYEFLDLKKSEPRVNP